jgi:hypothetical protein
MRPIGYARDVPMLHWIEMNVVDMALKIGVIANRMLPISTLPNTLLSLVDLACGSRPRIEAARKAALDQAPTRREIGVIFRQRPNCVNVIGQDANPDRFEWTPLVDSSVNLPQAINLIDQKVARPFGENNREKENATLYFSSNVPRHDASYHGSGGHASLCPPYENYWLLPLLPLRKMLCQKIGQHFDARRTRAAGRR